MNTRLFPRNVLLLTVAASLLALTAQRATAQTATDEFEVVRSVLKTDRKVVIAEAMQLTEAESTAFWPLYREYRADMDKLGDGIVKLVLQYADVYPNVPEDRAGKMLKDYLALEKDLVKVRAKYLKKLAKVLPKSKVLRFAQLENRLDLVLRLRMASVVPLMPVDKSKPWSSMSWIQRYKLRNYVRNSIWVLPVSGMVAALVLVNCLHWIEESAGWQSSLDPGAALALFGTLAGSMLTFIVFLSSSLLLVVQLASAQLTPRIIGVVFRDQVTRFAMTLFAFTFTFTLAVLVRIHASVPGITAHFAAYLCLLSVAVFLFLIDHVGKKLRPSGALLAVSLMGHKEIQNVYPRRLSGQPDASPGPVNTLGEPAGTVLSPNGGVLLAFDLKGIVALAREAECVIELVPEVGDFVAVGSPLFRIFGGQGGPPASALCQSVALGQERTMEQDPAFAFRIVVDIASKALSPAINDPTTAVLAIDQLHHLLHNVGVRHLDEGLGHDGSGTLRVVYRTPDWVDFVYLAVTEIRQFGGTSIQVTRRLRAMLQNLAEVLPPKRAALLRRELTLLQRSAQRCFVEPEDRALAEVSDLQGMGGKPLGDDALANELKPTMAGPKAT